MARYTPTHEPPDGEAWVHEIKYDGYRVQALIESGRVRLLTRTGLDWTLRFGPVADDFAALGVDAAIDCEAVVFDDAGVSNFGLLQRELRANRTTRIHMMVFDLLHYDGRDYSRRNLLDGSRRIGQRAIASTIRGMVG